MSQADNSARATTRVSSFDVWALGITIVIGGQYFSWNAGLTAGFGSYLIATLLTSCAYLCLCLCTSELTSALPFAWGACGLARCTLGYYAGFVVGCFESIEYIAYVASTVVSLGSMISSIAPGLRNYQPLVWFIFYATALVIHIFGGRWFWRINAIFAIFSLILVLIFGFGSIPYVDFDRYATPDGVWFVGGMTGFMSALRLAPWFFVGVESLVLTTNDVEDPRMSIVGGQVSCVLTLCLTTVLVLFISSSLPPGIETIAEDLLPFNRGFSNMFHLSNAQATILSLPATYATGFGFIFSYGKLMSAMAESNLYPSFLAHKYNGTPYGAMIVGSVIGYCLCVLQYVIPELAEHMYDICILGAFFAYIAQCIGFIYMRTRFATIKRDWYSPLGLPGAVFSIMVWLLSAVSVIGFAEDHQFALTAFVGVVGLGSIYYFLYAKSRQVFSHDEKKILFIAHVINFNDKKSRSLRRRVHPENGSLRALVSSYVNIDIASNILLSPRSAAAVMQISSTVPQPDGAPGGALQICQENAVAGVAHTAPSPSRRSHPLLAVVLEDVDRRRDGSVSGEINVGNTNVMSGNYSKGSSVCFDEYDGEQGSESRKTLQMDPDGALPCLAKPALVPTLSLGRMSLSASTSSLPAPLPSLNGSRSDATLHIPLPFLVFGGDLDKEAQLRPVELMIDDLYNVHRSSRAGSICSEADLYGRAESGFGGKLLELIHLPGALPSMHTPGSLSRSHSAKRLNPRSVMPLPAPALEPDSDPDPGVGLSLVAAGVGSRRARLFDFDDEEEVIPAPAPAVNEQAGINWRVNV